MDNFIRAYDNLSADKVQDVLKEYPNNIFTIRSYQKDDEVLFTLDVYEVVNNDTHVKHNCSVSFFCSNPWTDNNQCNFAKSFDRVKYPWVGDICKYAERSTNSSGEDDFVCDCKKARNAALADE